MTPLMAADARAKMMSCRRDSRAYLSNPLAMPAPACRRCGSQRLLPARDAHMALHRRALRAPVDDEIMPLWLAGDGRVDGLAEQRIVGAGPERLPEVRRVLLTEAHVK